MTPRLRIIMFCLVAAVAAAAAAEGAGGPAKTVLDNGLVVITSPGSGGKIAAVQVLIKASAADEPPGKAGLRQLLQQTLARGSENLPGDDLAAALDEIGAEFNAGVAPDYVQVYIVCLDEDLERALELLSQVVRRPRFAEREVERERQAALRHLASLRTDPFETAQALVRQGLYQGHPYAFPVQGTVESLKSITRSDLVSFHHRCFVPGNTIIAIAGAAPAEVAVAAVRRHFGDWAGAPPPPREVAPVRPLERCALQVRECPVGQAYFVLGFLADVPRPFGGLRGAPAGAARAVPSRVERRPDTYPVMEVMRTLLGRGMGSRFFGALREGAPAAYQADAHYFALAGGGYLAAHVATEARDLESTKDRILSEFQRLKNDPVKPDELKRAQEFAVGSHALTHQRARERAFHLAWYEAIGLGWEFDERYPQAVRAVTGTQVRAAARALSSRYALGLVLPGG
jgi:zinc protease